MNFIVKISVRLSVQWVHALARANDNGNFVLLHISSMLCASGFGVRSILSRDVRNRLVMLQHHPHLHLKLCSLVRDAPLVFVALFASELLFYFALNQYGVPLRKEFGKDR
ncbi:hypothetical protein SCHPADRAFT_939856 [Schizopora paradoxa]|uniref:Uncharacterized protein n=1 Tax=Schizopora paradoxa TaxID=27342 RepID=A0A0H2RQ32_9AGAM|nr:hypothetical protein SCHPADRAFT_939856 [Schizopora paradoxa]